MLADVRRGSTRDGAQPGAILFLHTVVRKKKLCGETEVQAQMQALYEYELVP
jgi:hypothetical protein